MPACSMKRRRTWQPKSTMHRYAKLEEQEARVKEKALAKANKFSSDPIEFFERVVGFKPFEYQIDLINKFINNQFTAARWCRQSGKSWIISALLLWYAISYKDSHIAVVGPSWRQTKRIISRITYFLRKLPPDMYFKPHKTYITFPSGSIIEAFPNNPDTIRGPTLNVVYNDEMNFIPNDADLYDAILFTLGTTNGKFICSSTPWNTDSIFWKIFNHKDFSDFALSHVPVDDALDPKGPLKQNIIEKIRKQFGDDPSRWRREMEAEWAEDEDVWLSQSLIASCVGTVKNCGQDLQPWDPDRGYRGELFAGIDLAQVKDYCVFSVLERENERLFVRHVKIFQQPTKYAMVFGYIKMLQDRWGSFQKVRVDFTKEGPSIISDMEYSGIKNAEGVHFTVARKSEMATLLRQRMISQKLFYPLLTWEKPYRGDICNELNIERFELRKDGAINFSHPRGTHDDVFWSLALGVYGTVDMVALDLESLRFG